MYKQDRHAVLLQPMTDVCSINHPCHKKLSYRRGTARRKFVLCFTRYESQKAFKQQKLLSRSFKGNGNGVIQ